MRSLRTTLLLAVNIPLVVGFAVLLALDYHRELSQQYRVKQIAMTEEAKTLLSAVIALRHHGERTIQDLIDETCARMVDADSPGHHIAVRMSDDALQARSHGRAAPGFVQAMEAATKPSAARRGFDGNMLVVGSASDQDIVVFVSEYAATIRLAARQRLVLRLLGMSALGLTLAVAISLLAARLVARPTESLSRTVHRIGDGDFDVTVPQFAIRELNDVATEVSIMSRSLAQAAERRLAQLHLAWRIQEKLLPDDDVLRSLGVHHLYQPTEEVGGDFLDVHVINEHQFTLCVGDVSGHGVPAAMGAALLKMLFQQAAAQTDHLDQLLNLVNAAFHAVTPEEMFATMTVVQVDRRNQRLIYASAGHEPSYLFDETDIVQLSPTGMLLGATPSSRWTSEEHEFDENYQVILFTDGLTEARSEDGSLLGRSQVQSLVAASRGRSPHDTMKTVIGGLNAHLNGTELTDDLTLVVCSGGLRDHGLSTANYEDGVSR